MMATSHQEVRMERPKLEDYDHLDREDYEAVLEEYVDYLLKREAEIRQLIEHEWRLKDHSPSLILNTIEQVLAAQCIEEAGG